MNHATCEQKAMLLALRQHQKEHEDKIVSLVVEHAQRIEQMVARMTDFGALDSDTDLCDEEANEDTNNRDRKDSDSLVEFDRHSDPEDGNAEEESEGASRRSYTLSTRIARRTGVLFQSGSLQMEALPSNPQPVHPFFLNVMKSTKFELSTLAAIIFNAIVIAIQVDWSVRHIGEELPIVFIILDVLFTCTFAIELLVRILASGLCFFCSCRNPDLTWNGFDSALVLSSFLEIPIMVMSGSSVNFAVARLLRLMRMVRMLRMVRLFRFFKMLRLVVQCVAASMKPLLWAFALLFLLIFLCSVIVLQFLEAEHLEDANVKQDYGSLANAQYTLFGCITGGRDWGDAAAPLVAISPLFQAIFIVYISISFFCIFNIVTSIFVENTKILNQQDEEILLLEEAAHRDAWLKEIKDLFEKADKDGSGDLTVDELEERLEDMKIQLVLKNLGIDVLSVNPRGLFNALDFDNSGSISINEFADGIMRFHGTARSLDLAELRFFTLQLKESLDKIGELVESRASPSIVRHRSEEQENRPKTSLEIMNKAPHKITLPPIKPYFDQPPEPKVWAEPRRLLGP